MGSLTRWIDQSLRRRITVVVSGLALALGVGVLVVSSFEVLRITRGLYAERLRQLGEQLAPLFARTPLDAEGRLRRLAGDPAVIRLARSGDLSGASGVRELFLHALSPDPRTAAVLLNRSGEPRLYQHQDSGSDWFGPPPVLGGPNGIGPFLRLDDTTVYYDIQVPVKDGEEIVGHLLRRARSPWSVATRNAVEALAGEGTTLVVGSPATGVWTNLGAVVPPPPDPIQGGDQVDLVTWGRERYLASGFPIAGTPWRLVVRVTERVIAAPAIRYLRRGGLIAVVVLLAGIFVGVALGRTLSRPLQGITEVAEQIASAEDPRTVPEDSPGEVGRLARAFNAMGERVASSTRRLRENEASHRAFVNYASDGIWRVEFVPPASTTLLPAIQVESWYRLSPRVEGNPALIRMSGREPSGEMGSVPLAELFPPDDPMVQRMWRDFIHNGYRIAGVELVTPGPEDSRRIFVNELVGVVDGGGLRRIWGTRRDITLSRVVDERLAQTDRLEAIGRLAGGVAHDFNNLLTAIVGYSESLQEDLPPDSSNQQDAAEITRIALRAAELTKQLLAFSRGQVMRPSLIDLNAVVRSSEGLLRRVLPENIRITLALDETIDAIEVDPGQLERVIMNLVVNARDAMPDGGMIEIRTAPARLDEDHVRTRPGVLAGEYVALLVRDTGSGMTEEVRQHIFEPFYTTKAKGKGTGLGLSTVYGIVRQSGGDVTVASDPGAGTTFAIYLPVKGKIEVVPVEGPLAAGGGILALTGQESILVVEDEAPVREIVRRALVASGYTVRVAREADEAFQVEANGAAIDLVLTDMILPGLNGRDLAKEFRKRRPGIRVLVMSGFTGDQSLAAELPEGAGYLAKPFSLADLRRRVREVLDGPARL
jgi:signal transduction histidine kinase/CheY-like chemotaxis protein